MKDVVLTVIRMYGVLLDRSYFEIALHLWKMVKSLAQ